MERGRRLLYTDRFCQLVLDSDLSQPDIVFTSVDFRLRVVLRKLASKALNSVPPSRERANLIGPSDATVGAAPNANGSPFSFSF